MKETTMKHRLFVYFLAIVSLLQGCRSFSPAVLPRSHLSFPHSVSGLNSGNGGSSRRSNTSGSLRRRRKGGSRRTILAALSDEAAFRSDDPFVILGLDGPTADKKVLKRAYKKRALKFHPDVVTDIHSTPEEKKRASDRFAKINGAYEQLMGKGKGNNSDGQASSSSASSTGGGWTPPHRRTGSYTSSSSSSSYSEGAGSTDWRDYMPDYRKDNDAEYDTGGDSFGQIFSDLFTGAASAAVSGGVGGLGKGIFNEFLEFLEGGEGGGFGGGSSQDDADLRVLLQTGSLEEVAEEMDDTEMVVKQLETKSKGLDDEIFAMDAEARMTSRFSEKIELEERGASLKARKDVVNGYLARARKRLLSLQTRYKDLIAYGGARDDYATGGGSRSSWKDVREEASTQGPSSYSSSSSSSSSYGSTAPSGEKSATRDKSSGGEEDSWMNEGFGSSRSRRGSSRRGSSRRRASARRSSASSGANNPSSPSTSGAGNTAGSSRQPPPRESYSTQDGGSRNRRPPPQRETPSPSPSRSSSVTSRSNYSSDVPPHRRTTSGSSFASRQEEDRKRMQEIKVDEEFEKLKKELGL